ncbi:hypothetical protein EST38_g14550 [Candolleomyces aberdarensis]|uniref:F-box domain-containing protein n=1 Tax=Candolleomyces aberdarensis TaxID=2316362 RepID=A0A4Q2CZM8_9AGAR|nr:hypothetical protein EST38_g14550 [Candolleomyces aberdarensis]
MKVLSDYDRFPELPEDIGRTVFELAAENGDGPSCALVSKRVRFWVEPKIYHRVMLRRVAVADLFCRTLLDAETHKPPEFFATHVKVFILAYINVNEKIAAALKKCRGVRTLLIWDLGSEMQEIFGSTESLLSLNPTGISICGQMIAEGQDGIFHHPIFRNVTHLDLACFDEDDLRRWGKNLSQLKCLTHFSLDLRYRSSSPAQMAREALCLCASELRIFIIWCYGDHFFESHISFGDVKAIWEGEVDMRAVTGCMHGRPAELLAIFRDSGDIFRDWAGTSVDPENDFWAQAEAVVQGRRQRLEQVGITTSHVILSFN